MLELHPRDDAFRLDHLAEQIRASSNFRFAWQFFDISGFDARSANDMRKAMKLITSTPANHEFLLASFDSLNHESFEIDLPHEHCPVVSAMEDFEDVLARAAADRLGAYSADLSASTPLERVRINTLFASAGDYVAYELVPGKVADCPICKQYNNKIFTNWFYGVAWDWCFLVTWPERNLLWIGCLTDTD